MRSLFIIAILLPAPAFSIQDKKQETLELAWQSFVYSKQLENAYKLSKEAVKLYPQETIWLERLAQICVWTARTQEAADTYEKIYAKDKNSASLSSNLKILRNLKTELYFKIAEQNLEKNFSEKDFDDLLLLYGDYGEEQRAAALADKYIGRIKSPRLKEKLAFFYLRRGQIEKAELLFSQSSKNMTCEFMLEKSKFYFLRKEYRKSADILEKKPSCISQKDYAFFFADLMFFLGEYDKSAQISEISMHEGFYREQDAESVFNYYMRKDRSKAAGTAMAAYKKFKKEYFLHFYIASEKDEKIKRDFLEKEAKENKDFYKYYLSISDTAKGAISSAKAVADIKNIRDAQLTSQYIWNLFQNANLSLREAAGNYFNCIRGMDDSLYLPLAYLKSSYGAHKEALYCFRRYMKNSADGAQPQAQYSDFLRNAGFYSEADFYARKAYNTFSKSDKEKFSAEELRLFLIFSNQAYFKEKLEKSGLSGNEKLDLELSYLYRNDLKENALHLSDKNSGKAPAWAKFSSIYEKNGGLESFHSAGYSPPSRDLSYLYLKQGKQKEAKAEIGRAEHISPDEPQNHILWRSLFLNKNNENGFYSQIEDKNFAQSFKKGAKAVIKDSQRLKLSFQAEQEKMNFFSGHGFAVRKKNYHMLSFFSAGQTWNAKISSKKRMEDFYSFLFQKSFELKELNISLSAGLNEESGDTFSLENAGKADFFSQEISARFSSRLSGGLKNSLYNYRDQKGSYAGKASFQELYFFLPEAGLRPYMKIAGYNKSPLPSDSALGSLYTYQNPSMLARSFSEAGLNAYIFKDRGLSYSSIWEHPLSISISYNSRTFLNYSAELYIKTPGLAKKDGFLSIIYSQGAYAENGSIVSCRLFVNFR